jgi:membrane associated rhomboid family serine protease
MTEPAPAREPIFNAPWTALAAALAIVASYLAQGTMSEEAWSAGALVPAALFGAGRWETLVSSLFLHGGWAHTLMNAAGALAFGAPVARLLGLGARGALAFALFYMLCGVLSGLGYALVHPQSFASVVGASGAVSGLMGAASRLVDGRGALGPILSRTSIGMAAAWVAVNLLLGFTTLTPGAGGAHIAWEAHLAGYFAGLLLIGLFARVLGGPRFANR